jgi:hypothetical protein
MTERSKYESLKLDELRTLAKDRHISAPAGARQREELVDALVAHDVGSLPPAVRLDVVDQVPAIVDSAASVIARRFPNFASIQRALTRQVEVPDEDLRVFWISVLLHTESIAFPRFQEFVARVLGSDQPGDEAPDSVKDGLRRLRHTHPIPGTDLYKLLKTAAEAFLLLEGGVATADTDGRWANNLTVRVPRDPETGAQDPTASIPGGVNRLLPQKTMTYKEAERHLMAFLGSDSRSYLRAILPSVFPDGCVNVGTTSTLWDRRFVSAPALLELIWSYWHEEGMLSQTMNAITLRFQNVRRGGGRDPLAELELDTLRPLSGFIWGYIQDEPQRLSLVRRAYEYNHHYGLTLFGRAVPALRPADARSRFIEAFHTLLRECDLFIKQDNDMTINPDAFAVLSSLKEVHLSLSEGAHNQFRDLPWTARAEMLIQQWMISRREMREFLRGRLMVAYPEQWMGGVDAMKRMQGWHEPSSIVFNDLARYGERLLISIRYVAWNAIGDQAFAKAWVRFWKEEIQGYIHAYQVVTGVNLTDTPVVAARTRDDGRFLPPAVHLRNRLLNNRSATR